MPAIHITKALLANLPVLPEGKVKVRVFDTRTKGFIAEIRRGGALVCLYFRYTDPRGRQREIKLGRLGDVSLDQARKRAELLKAETSLGADPVAEAAKRKAVPTLEAFVGDRYLPHSRDHHRNHGTVAAYCRRIVAALGRRPLDEITPAAVAAFRQRLLDERLPNGKPHSNAGVNRHLGCLRNMLALARRWQLCDGPNPAASPGMLPERNRDCILTAAETRALVAALDREPNRSMAAALMVLTVTGARKNEVLKARWDWVDLADGTLLVPRSKNGKPRRIVLPPFAVEVLLEQQRHRHPGDGGFVFPGAVAGQPLGDCRGAFRRAKAAADLPAALTIHGLRHSWASCLANAGVPLAEIGTLLGHRSQAVTARYAHYAPARLASTAALPVEAWDLLAGPSGVG